jgi:hypothetical protein
MRKIKLHMVSNDGVEATISTDGSQGGVEDYYAVVSVSGFIKEKKVYGIDPIQSFVLGLKLIEDFTMDKRIGNDDKASMTPGASWRIEVVDD